MICAFSPAELMHVMSYACVRVGTLAGPCEGALLRRLRLPQIGGWCQGRTLGTASTREDGDAFIPA